MNRNSIAALAVALATAPIGWIDGAAFGQGVSATANGPMAVNTAPTASGGASPTLSQPLTRMAPVPSRSSIASPDPPSVSLGNPTYDPYHGGQNPGVFQPALPQHPAIPPTATVPGGAAASSIFGGLPGGSTGYTGSPPPSAFAPPPPPPMFTPTPVYPPSAYPSPGPPVLFPGGLFGGGGGMMAGAGGLGMPAPIRFFQGPRLQHTWLAGGDDPNDLGINTTDASLAFAFPNFLYSGQPIYVLPSFSLHLWDGPFGGTADLPAQAYDAFVDFGWQTDPNQMVGIETGLRAGVFTDFETMNSDSFRIRGLLLGKFRTTPQTTLKAGLIYVNRNDLAVLPAGGLLWQPNPHSRWDIYFPEPKVSRYLSTLGTQDVWGYLAGEFGGGSWTITRDNGEEDSIDINDFRVLAGVEWGRSDLISSGRRTGFMEAGWVFGREVEYEENPQDNFDAESTFVIRAGIGY